MSLPELSKGMKKNLEQMTPKQLIMLALAASFIITLLLYFYLSGLENRRQEQDKPGSATVLVAAVDIPERTVIQAGMLAIVQVPADLLQPDAITDIRAAEGKIASAAMLKGDPVTARKLFADNRLAGFTGRIPADKRAVSIAITDTTGLSGFAKPGDFVDVMLISDKLHKNAVSGRLLLQNVLLLAMNRSSTAEDGKAEPKKEQMATATLALAPEEAVRLAVAQSQGTVYLTLRPFKPSDSFILMSEVFSPQLGREEERPATAPAVRPQELPRSLAPAIPVIRGNAVHMTELK